MLPHHTNAVVHAMGCRLAPCLPTLTLSSLPCRARRVPHHMQELLVKVRAIKARHAEAGEREPSDEEVAAELKVRRVVGLCGRVGVV